MYIIDDIAYANDFNNEQVKIKEVKIVAELCMLVTFSNGEKKIFDMKNFIKYSVYEKLKNYELFKKAYVEHGMIIWDNGEIDIAPETVYNNSYIYEQELAM